MNKPGRVIWRQPIESSDFDFEARWDSEGRMQSLRPIFDREPAETGLQPVDISEDFFLGLPYGIASFVRELQFFFRSGGPMLPFPWVLTNTTEITDFQIAVYRASMQIPCGETRSYQWIADKIRKPKAVRAVGQALRKNPFPIFIPCHRVVSGSGLGGYMGEDDPRAIQTQFKELLLKIEGKYRSPPLGEVFERWIGESFQNSARV